MKQPPLIHIDDADEMQLDRGPFKATLKRVTAELGARNLGCTVVELEPGKRAWPLHLHFGMEELFFVLEGHGTLRYDDGEHPIRAGEFFFAPTGKGTAHQIVNTSDGTLRYLAISSAADPEICYYPDSKKYGAYVWREDDSGVRFMAHEDSALDYYDGET